MDHPTPSDSSGDVDLRELLFQFLEELDAGDAAFDSLVNSYCTEHPELEKPFRASVKELFDSGLVGGDEEVEIPPGYGGYQIERRLGVGGMGTVYLARRSGGGEAVALKVIHAAELLLGGRSRFAREAEAVQSLDHPGIAKLLDAQLDGDEPYLAFEYIEGQSLDAAIRRAEVKDPRTRTGALLSQKVSNSPHPPWVAAASEAVLQLADALQHAHGRGVLHRDLKPANVIVGPDGLLTLVDFGLASLAGAQRLTRTGTQLGSLPYMAPEQIREAKNSTSVQSDVYSLGVTFYELLTLQHPFLSSNPEAMRQRILEGRCTTVRERSPDVPSSFSVVCMKSMEPDPAHRYRDVAAFALDLQRAVDGKHIEARPPGVLRRGRHWAKRRPMLATGLVALMLLVVSLPLTYVMAVARESRRVLTLNDQLSKALEAARASQLRAEKGTRIARESIMELSARAASEKLPDVPNFQRVTHELLVSSRRLYEELRESDPDDLGLLRDLAKLIKLDALALYRMGEETKAEAALVELDSTLERLIEQGEAPIKVHAERASVAAINATRSFNGYDLERTLSEADTAIEHCNAVLSEDPSQEQMVLTRLGVLGLAARASAYQGKREAMGGYVEQTKSVVDDLLADAEPSPRVLMNAADAMLDLRTAAVKAEEPQEALALSSRAIECIDVALGLAPDSVGVQSVRFEALSAYGDSLRLSAGNLDAATDALEEAKLGGKKLAERFPDAESHLSNLMETQRRLASVMMARGDHSGALAEFEDLSELAMARYQERPDAVSRRGRALISMVNFSQFALRMPEEDMGRDASQQLTLDCLARARAILSDVPEDEAVGLRHLAFRIHHTAVLVRASRRDAAAWDDLALMESVIPMGPGEALSALEAYGFALDLLDDGVLPPDVVSVEAATEWMTGRVAAHLGVYAPSPGASVAELAEVLPLSRFERDAAVAESLSVLKEK